jgi:hypothetical protein
VITVLHRAAFSRILSFCSRKWQMTAHYLPLNYVVAMEGKALMSVLDIFVSCPARVRSTVDGATETLT